MLGVAATCEAQCVELHAPTLRLVWVLALAGPVPGHIDLIRTSIYGSGQNQISDSNLLAMKFTTRILEYY